MVVPAILEGVKQPAQQQPLQAAAALVPGNRIENNTDNDIQEDEAQNAIEQTAATPF